MAKKELSPTQKTLRRVQMYQNVFSGPEGAQVLHDLLSVHGILKSSYNGDVNEMLFKEGERNVVLRILSILKTNPAQLLERLKEYEQQ